MIKILLLICVSIESIAFYLYNRILFSAKKPPVYQILSYIISYLLVFVIHGVSSFQNLFANIIVFFIANIFVLLFLYNIKVYSAITHAALLCGFSILSEVIVGILIEIITGSYWQTWNSNANLLIMSSSVLVYSVLTISSAFIEKWIKSLDKLEIIAVPLSLFSLITFIAILIDYFNFHLIFSNTAITIMNICILLILLFGNVFIYIYMYRTGNAISRQNQQTQIENNYVNFVDKMQEKDLDQRILIHDIKNHLISISDLCDKGKENNVKDYIEKLLNAPMLKPSARYCDNDFINSIINRYKEEAEKHNIEFIVTSNTIELSFVDNYDITILLCNLFENAIEAASKTNPAFIHITFSFDPEKNISIIGIVNSCHEKVTFVNEIPVTSKPIPHDHGLGIKSIKRVVEKHNGSINMYQDNDYAFHTIILLDWRDTTCE